MRPQILAARQNKTPDAQTGSQLCPPAQVRGLLLTKAFPAWERDKRPSWLTLRHRSPDVPAGGGHVCPAQASWEAPRALPTEPPGSPGTPPGPRGLKACAPACKRCEPAPTREMGVVQPCLVILQRREGRTRGPGSAHPRKSLCEPLRTPF